MFFENSIPKAAILIDGEMDNNLRLAIGGRSVG
jgi:hypothetical protein